MQTNLLQAFLQRLKRLVTSFMTGNVATSLAELVQLLGVAWTFEFDWRSDDFDEIFMTHFVGSEADDFEVVGEEASFFLGAF